MEDAKKFVKEHAWGIGLCATGITAFCTSYMLLSKATQKENAAFLEGLAKGAGNVLVWAAKNAPDANLPELWDSELADTLKKMGMEVTQF